MDKKAKKKILIAGVGISGIFAAILLDKDKFEVTLIERSKEFRNSGFSFTVWEDGFLSIISLLEKNLEGIKEGKDYYKTDKFCVYWYDTSFKQIKQYNVKNLIWVFNRAHLMQMLEKILRKTLPAKNIYFSKHITDVIYREDGKADVVFNTANQETFDVVIIAEGINSTTRKLLFENKLSYKPSNSNILHEEVEPFKEKLRYEWFKNKTSLGDHCILIFAKEFTGIVHPPSEESLLGYYSKVGTKQKEKEKFESSILGSLSKENASSMKVDNKTAGDFVFEDVNINRYFFKNTVFVGDAAHGHHPMIGFGTTIAVEDILLLTKLLNNLKEDEEYVNNMYQAFEYYTKKRKDRFNQIFGFQKFISKFLLQENKYVRKIILVLVKFFLADYLFSRVKILARYKTS